MVTKLKNARWVFISMLPRRGKVSADLGRPFAMGPDRLAAHRRALVGATQYSLHKK